MRLVVRCPECRLMQSENNSVCKCGTKLVKGDLYYHTEVRYNGQTYRKKISKDRKLSLIALADTEKSIIEDTYDIQRGRYTFRQLSLWYLSLPEVKEKRTFEKIRVTLKSLSVTFGEMKPNDRLISAFSDYQRQRLEVCSPATVNKETSTARSMLETAVRHRKIRHNPLNALRTLKEKNRRVVDLTDEQVKLIIDNCPPSIKPVTLAASRLLLRRTELLTMMPNCVDQERWVLSVLPEFDKSERGRTCPVIDDDMKVILEERIRCHPNKPVFGTVNPNYLSDTFRFVCNRIGLDDVKFHDLRHYSAMRICKLGYQPIQIMRWAGWKSLDIFFRYTATSGDVAVNQ